MNYPIDVLFCTWDWTIAHVVRTLRPRRVTRIVWRSRAAIELPAGAIPDAVLRGDRLVVKRVGQEGSER